MLLFDAIAIATALCAATALAANGDGLSWKQLPFHDDSDMRSQLMTEDEHMRRMRSAYSQRQNHVARHGLGPAVGTPPQDFPSEELPFHNDPATPGPQPATQRERLRSLQHTFRQEYRAQVARHRQDPAAHAHPHKGPDLMHARVAVRHVDGAGTDRLPVHLGWQWGFLRPEDRAATTFGAHVHRAHELVAGLHPPGGLPDEATRTKVARRARGIGFIAGRGTEAPARFYAVLPGDRHLLDTPPSQFQRTRGASATAVHLFLRDQHKAGRLADPAWVDHAQRAFDDHRPIY